MWGRFDVVARPAGEDLAADQTGDARPTEEGDDQRQAVEPGSIEHRDEEEDRQRGDREQDIDGTHADRVDGPAEVAGDGADQADRKSTRLNPSHYCATRMPS